MDVQERKIRELRHLLHENAELSGKEEKTRRILKEFLREHTHLEIKDEGPWFYAKYKGNPGDSWVALRADFDALPAKDGTVKHLCGHDGHAAALCYTGMLLEENHVKENVILLFQPAEETGTGAVLCSGLFEKENVRAIYGCHNLPGFPLGIVYTKPGTFACASRGLEMTLTGKPTHAAYPENGISPAPVLGKLLRRIDELNESAKEKLCMITVIGADMGSESYGIAADQAVLRVTLRAENDEDLASFEAGLLNYAGKLCAERKLEFSFRVLDPFPATVNVPEHAEHILKACGGKVLETPMRWSEDFGNYLRGCPGAFFGIGSGENCPGLHTENYEYPDEILRFTAHAFFDIVTVK